MIFSDDYTDEELKRMVKDEKIREEAREVEFIDEDEVEEE